MGTQQFSSLPSQPKISSLPGVGDLLAITWQICKERIGVFLGIMAIPIIASFGIALFIVNIFSFSEELQRPYLTSLAWIPVILIVAALALVISIWSSVALLYAIKERDGKIGAQEAFAKGWSKIISYFWISLLMGLIVAIGFILFIIPGIIFLVWFGLAVYVLVSENLTGMKALSRSKQLVNGHWGEVFLRYAVIFIIVIVVNLVLGFIFAPIEAPWPINIESTLSSLFLAPFFITYTFLIYEDLRKIKEGTLV